MRHGAFYLSAKVRTRYGTRHLPGDVSTDRMRLLRSFSAVLVTVAAVLAAPRADAQSKLEPEVGWNYGEVETARTAALGGAARAFGSATSGLYLNPASMATTRVYHLEALAQIWPEAKRQTYGAGAVDSVTTKLAGGIGGHYGIQDSEGLKRKWTDVRFALAYPFSDKLFAGLGGRYLKLQQNGFGPLGDSLASGGLRNETMISSLSFDAGLTLKPSKELAIAILGQNLTNPGTGFQPTMFGGGVGYGTDDFTIEGDVLADFTTWIDPDGSSKTTLRGMLGAEYLAGDHYPLRLGYRYDEGQKTHAVSGGLGYVDPQFALEVSVRRTVAGPDVMTPATSVIIGLQYFLESTGITRAPMDMD